MFEFPADNRAENQSLTDDPPAERPEGFGRGGKRPGAGRPKGSRTRMLTEPTEQAVERIRATISAGLAPLEYLLSVMRGDGQDGRPLFETAIRIEAAKAAAPYVHRKQPQDVTVGGSLQVPVSITMQVVGPRR